MSNGLSEFDPQCVILHSYRIVKAEIDTPLDYTGYEQGEYSYKVHFESAFRLDDNWMRTMLEVEVELPSENLEEKGAKAYFQIIFYFEVLNLEDLVTLKKKKPPLIDENLHISLASVTYSTSRGILMTRLENTALKGFFLPIISPSTLINTSPIRL